MLSLLNIKIVDLTFYKHMQLQISWQKAIWKIGIFVQSDFTLNLLYQQSEDSSGL